LRNEPEPRRAPPRDRDRRDRDRDRPPRQAPSFAPSVSGSEAGGVVQATPGDMPSRTSAPILPPMAQPTQPSWKQDKPEGAESKPEGDKTE